MITLKNIDAFTRRAFGKGCRELAWNEDDFKILQSFASKLGYPIPQDGDSFMGIKHTLVEGELYQDADNGLE